MLEKEDSINILILVGHKTHIDTDIKVLKGSSWPLTERGLAGAGEKI